MYLIEEGEFEISEKLIHKKNLRNKYYVLKAKNNDLAKLKEFRVSIISKYHVKTRFIYV